MHDPNQSRDPSEVAVLLPQPPPTVMATSTDDPAPAVAAIWHRVLRTQPGDTSASITDLSIGAGRVVRLMSEIKDATGVALPITVIFQAQTLDNFIEVVRRGVPPPFVPQVLVKRGSAGPALFILPGLGGSVFQLLELAAKIEFPGAIYLNQQQGLEGGAPPHRTIDDIATFQLAAIKEIQPRGPYFLIGYSLGGLAALELARRLVDNGESVAFIGMIEPGLPETLWPLSVRAGFFLSRIAHHWKSARVQSLRGMLGYFAGHLRPMLGRIGRLLGTDAGGWSPYRAEGLPPDLAALRDANIEAAYSYKLKRFDGRVTFFKSQLGDPLSCDPLKVWPRYIRNLTVETVPGGHESMLRKKNATILASAISAHLSDRTVNVDRPPAFAVADFAPNA
jgi:thioesterase domain-containing protein